MNISCEFCNSYVTPTEKGSCPNCGANLGENIKTQNELLKKEQTAKERELKKDIEKQRNVQFIIQIIQALIGTGGSFHLKVSRIKHKAKSCFIVFVTVFIVLFVLYFMFKFNILPSIFNEGV